MAEEKQQEKESKRVVFDKKALLRGKNEFDLGQQEVEVPELNAMMQVAEGETTIMVVRQMTFDESTKMQSDHFDMMRNLVEGIVEASASKDAVKKETLDALDKQNLMTRRMIDTVAICLVEPKLTRQEVMYICKMYPTVATRLYGAIINLTNKGATLKKNSTG